MKFRIFLVILLFVASWTYANDFNWITTESEVELLTGYNCNIYGEENRVLSKVIFNDRGLEISEEIRTYFKINRNHTGSIKYIDNSKNEIIKEIKFTWEYITEGPENIPNEPQLEASSIKVGFYPPYYILKMEKGRIDYIQPANTKKNGDYLIWLFNLGKDKVFLQQYFINSNGY